MANFKPSRDVDVGVYIHKIERYNGDAVRKHMAAAVSASVSITSNVSSSATGTIHNQGVS